MEHSRVGTEVYRCDPTPPIPGCIRRGITLAVHDARRTMGDAAAGDPGRPPLEQSRGFAAALAQTYVTLHWAGTAAASIPNIGASGAIAAVLGAYLILLPGARILTLLFGFLPWRISAGFFLLFWSSNYWSSCFSLLSFSFNLLFSNILFSLLLHQKGF